MFTHLTQRARVVGDRTTVGWYTLAFVGLMIARSSGWV